MSEFLNRSTRGVEYVGRSKTFGEPLLYVRVGDSEINQEDAYQEIVEALKLAFDPNNPDSVVAQLSSELSLGPDVRVTLDFLNHGNDSLEYLATINNGKRIEKLVALVNQPRREFGSAMREYENLIRLSEIDSMYVVRPLSYFQHGNQEMYITPYIENARCVYGGYGRWGVFDPVPRYHFEPFATDTVMAVTTAMISLLVRYYDKERGQGLAKTQLSGDDFVLLQDWDMGDSATVLQNMRLIAAREMIRLPLDEYLELLETEFIHGTHYRDELYSTFKVNSKSEIALPKEVVRRGIEIGLTL